MSRVMTIEGIGYNLLNAGLLSSEQAREFQVKAEVQRVKLIKQQETGRRGQKAAKPHHEITPVDVLASFHFRIPTDTGQILTEERIMQALASAAGLSYHKIDPLKLDASVVTVVPRPFALKHALVPLQILNDVLTIATADPFNQETLEHLKRFTGYQIKPVVSVRTDILKVITEFHGFRSLW